MTECSGNICFMAEGTVTGRLLRIENAHRSVGEYAKILIWDGVRELVDSSLEGAVGLILCDCPNGTVKKQARRIAELYRLPSMEVNAKLPENTVAILDTRHKKLFINPDLETIGAYLSPSTQASPSKTVLTLDGECFPLPYGFDGVTVGADIPRSADEQQTYEYLCDISDSYTGLSIVAHADLSLGAQGFRKRLRAIYRAGVWGRFSLLCTSVSTPEQVKECIMTMHEVFHELDTESREFDGFMSKGLLIDTPLMLLSRAETRMIDFFYIDVKKLRRLFSGSEKKGVGEEQTVKYVGDFIKASAPCRIILKNVGELSDTSVSTLLSTGRISEICVKKSEKDRCANLL